MVNGIGKETRKDPVAAIAKSYEEGVTDEFLLPTICTQNAQNRSGRFGRIL